MRSICKLTPTYPHNAIIDPQHLALLLNTPLESLKATAKIASGSYRPVPQTKRDGSPRMTYDAYPELKRIQHQIVKKILRKVRFPRYLQGGIRDTEFPRDHVSNAALHTGASILVLDDIADFYPSLESQLVFTIWLRFFGFSPDVSELLTKLTTRHCVVPQGARTSSYLANLAFWDKEAKLVEDLGNMGLTYSRFVDDVSYSSHHQVSNSTIGEARAKVYRMLASKGCRPKRSKSQVCRKGQKLKVTGLVAAGNYPAVGKAERKRIRSAVHNLEKAVGRDGMTPENLKAWNSAKGRVGMLFRLEHLEARSLSQRLDTLL
ncbi:MULTISPECIES: reverse transcriptase family protein [Vreelandella]|uniref:RNA-directed DNA polymerase n=1 Tax=Vreelandella salicampi TaxID=1449798 RepID=A0A7Z0RVU4_9GAMM|nr:MULTISPECIES: reverse transcriptase family protein [Halomonas]MCD2088612.1 reverse transcriptase family protein [Halomonas meridiana]NYS61972.1 RNA-directed DNA polymerase [Halomonas salicampi]